jgi:hypothetical protein
MRLSLQSVHLQAATDVNVHSGRKRQASGGKRDDALGDIVGRSVTGGRR